jgi:hypothetical protein
MSRTDLALLTDLGTVLSILGMVFAAIYLE